MIFPVKGFLIRIVSMPDFNKREGIEINKTGNLPA